jgi:hypothetical protein
MDLRYNIYFGGQLLEGQDMASVRNKLARLFNADEQTLDKLFSGKAQLIKRECDKATALKFKQAIEQAGALPIIKEVATSPPAPAEAPAPPKPAPTMTAAERIAALAEAPDLGTYDTAADQADEAGPSEAQPGEAQPVEARPGEARPGEARPGQAEPAPAVDSGAETINLAPQGTAVLRPQERKPVPTREVDTTGIALDESGEQLSEPSPPPPAAPDTSHLSMGAAGDTIPTLPTDAVPVEPNTDALDLAPAGTDFSDCAAPETEMPALDLSAIELAPSGAEVLDEKYRQRQQAKAPATDHLSLED